MSIFKQVKILLNKYNSPYSITLILVEQFYFSIDLVINNEVFWTN